MDRQELIDEINRQRAFLTDARSAFPYVTSAYLGQRVVQSPPFYRAHGYTRKMFFDRPLTQQDLEHHRGLRAWLNQNYIVRLYAILEAHGVIPSEGTGQIDQSLENWYDVELVRRLRNKYAHRHKYYKPGDDDDRLLFESIRDRFNVTLAVAPDEADDYPLPIDLVLYPITDRCINYICQL